MKFRRRCILPFASVVIGLPITIFAAWHWWPDGAKLTGAAAKGDVRGVRLCLRFGVNPNEPSRWGWQRENEGQTPLTAAAQYGRVEVVRVLLQSGADPNLRDFGSEHQTALSTAAMLGQLEVCRLLLEAGADPNVPTKPKQPGVPGNWTALDWALQANQAAVSQLLRQHGGRESGQRGGDEGQR